VGNENSIFGCKRICDIILLYLGYSFEWIYSIYTNECYFCYRPTGTNKQFAVGQ
jgi:hypothetical protein